MKMETKRRPKSYTIRPPSLKAGFVPGGNHSTGGLPYPPCCFFLGKQAR